MERCSPSEPLRQNPCRPVAFVAVQLVLHWGNAYGIMWKRGGVSTNGQATKSANYLHLQAEQLLGACKWFHGEKSKY